MDPGTALGAFSIIFQVFAGCIKGFELLLEAKDLPQKYGYLRHRLHLEQHKLLDWWNASSLTAEVALQGTPLDKRTQIMIDSLVYIKSLTLDINRIKERYDLALKYVDDSDTLDPSRLLAIDLTGTYSTRETLRLKCLKYADTVLQCPTRLRWAVFDAVKFEQLLVKLAELNNSLHFNLELEQRQRHIQLQETTNMQILKVHKRLDQVVELIQALHLHSCPDSGGTSSNSNRNGFGNLERLAQLKALSIGISSGDSTSNADMGTQLGLAVPLPGSLLLSMSLLEVRDSQERDRAVRIGGTYGSTAVWIEWKTYDESNSTFPYHRVEDRITRLATLLFKDSGKPEELRLPAALGYVHDQISNRFGLVFESPALTNKSLPQSLYTRLQSTAKPSLTIRLGMARRLATSLNYLHATKWLHKGLRSDNILFPASSGSDWLSFCLSGFDYSHPTEPGEVTEPPSDNKEHDLYRHPDVQFDVPRDGEYGYKEKHDVYSLGVILMEIGLWQSIRQFLDISLDQLVSRSAVRETRKRLLKVESLAVIESEAGERFSEAVRLCLVDDVEHPPDTLESAGAEENVAQIENQMGSLQRVQDILRSIAL